MPVLLTTMSIAALIGLATWQAWIRYGEDSSSQNTVLPDQNAATPPKAPEVAPAVDNEPDDDGAFLRDYYQDKIITAAAMVGLGAQGGGSAAAELVLIHTGQTKHLWILGAPESAPPLRPQFLKFIQDDEPVASGTTGKKRNDLEFEAYMEALGKASLTPASAFANSAKNAVNHGQLMQDPVEYRGDVIHVEGRLKRLRRFNPPAAVAERMTDFYEGWIVAKERKGDLFCVVFMELPEGIWVGETLDQPVAFDGYFFKRYLYGKTKTSKAPLLIGRSIIPKGEPIIASTDGGASSSSMLIVFFVLMFATVGLAAGLTWWFRRGDRHVRARIAETMPVPLLHSLESEEVPLAAPVSERSASDQTPRPAHPLSPPRFTPDPSDATRL